MYPPYWVSSKEGTFQHHHALKGYKNCSLAFHIHRQTIRFQFEYVSPFVSFPCLGKAN